MSGSPDYTLTPNLGLFMPNYDMDDGTWGAHLNQNASVLDAVIGSSVHGPFLPLAGGTVTGATIFGGSVRLNGTVGFNNTAPIARPTVTGSRGGNAAVASLLTQLAAYGLITDSTTA